MKSVKSFSSFCELSEAKKTATAQDADKFISQVLKMGSRDNLVDKFLKSEGIDPEETSALLSLVVARLKEKWLYEK